MQPIAPQAVAMYVKVNDWFGSFGYCFTPTDTEGAAGHIILTPANQLMEE
jgi:hypothetical protein